MSIEVFDKPGIPLDSPGRYVVGIDGSGPSLAALHWALQRADHYGAEVTLAHVSDPDAPGRAGRVLLDSAASIAAVAHPAVRISQILLSGPVAMELARESTDADLLVVGTHKTGYLHGRVMGSQGVFLASLACSSLAIIPDVSLVSRRGIVVGVDSADDSLRAVQMAAREADRAQQYLTVLTADSSPHFHPLTFPRVERGGGMLALAVERAIRCVPGLEVHSRASGRTAADALLDASRSATLLVLSASLTAHSVAAPVGAVTHDILMNINSPVLIVRDEPHPIGAGTTDLSAAGRTA